jgi:hypothetical protein
MIMNLTQMAGWKREGTHDANEDLVLMKVLRFSLVKPIKQVSLSVTQSQKCPALEVRCSIHFRLSPSVRIKAALVDLSNSGLAMTAA